MARAHHTTLPQDENVQTIAPAARTGRRGVGAETWLVGGGVLMMLLGVLLVLVPSFMPQYGWAVRSLAARGVTSLPIAIGGLVLCGIAFAGRSSRRDLGEVIEAARGAAPAIEDLAQQVAHLGDGLQGLRIEFVYLKDALQSQIERVQASTGSETAGDAVYRLAASLDQVGMRIEERFNAGQRDLGEALRAVSNALEALREENAKVGARLDEQATAPRSYALDDEAERYADDWPAGNGERATPAARLGLLDMLDDLGRLLPGKPASTAGRGGIETDPFEDIQDEGWEAASIPAPLPSLRDEEMHLAEPANLLGRGMPHTHGPKGGEVLNSKLEELRGLLADVRVREALAELEKSRR